ncbi:MAG: phage tail sheath C-terminal domain-containing protein [Balneolales bacterium]
MQNLKTPGVYIQEISKLPASVAPVATAVPAFIGYTEKRVRGEEQIPPNTAVMVRSLLEYEEIFGGPFNEDFTVTLDPDVSEPGETKIQIAPADASLSPYRMYYCMRFFFANGGGKCYIVSVGGNGYAGQPGPDDIDHEELLGGLHALEEEDEPTLLVIPEAIYAGGPEDRKSINDAMLEQCGKLKDRFSILDVPVAGDGTPSSDAAQFRTNETGKSNLSYGAAYYPALNTTLRRSYDETAVNITDNRGGAGNGRFHEKSLHSVTQGIQVRQGVIEVLSLEDLENGDELVINDQTFTFHENEGDGDIQIKNTLKQVADEIADVADQLDDFDAERLTGTEKVIINFADDADDKNSLTITFTGSVEALRISVRDTNSLEPDKVLYNDIKRELDKKRLTLYPSSAMAGVYARVDRNRGVWKAPANVSLNLVSEPAVLLTGEEQAPLNVDVTTGKSINGIPKFHQKGTLVWGARTLAGNDNEWRYIPVRRLFIFIEESIKKATGPVVFEPNVANTWARSRSMIESFLSDLWREGALAGATPEEAFFVSIGLGETMSANDVLNGRLIIDIGLAAVRPAEFIVLQFMHKLQES